jgi:hypothetical protein
VTSVDILAEGGRANVVDVDVDVIGGAAVLIVGVTGLVPVTAGVRLGEVTLIGLIMLVTLLVEP